ncbi:MAG: hypothetical protein R3293_21285, partial [Candidatus Promineifilaceae bacterium]|nr:hypothetical protein [Candidatus Promineifilaceae bacterium]
EERAAEQPLTVTRPNPPPTAAVTEISRPTDVATPLATAERVTPTVTAVPPTATAAAETGDSDPDWERYINTAYGFSFRYPALWSVVEEDNLLILSHEALRMGIAFRSEGQVVDPPWTGMPAGELTDDDGLPFLEGTIRKQVLIYKGKVKAVFYGPAEGDVIFEMRVDDGTADYEQIDIAPHFQDTVDEMISSFAALDPAHASDDARPNDETGAVSVGRLPQRCANESLGDSLFVNPVDGYCLRYPANFEPGDIYPPGIANLYGRPYDCSPEPVRAAVTLRVVEMVGEQSLDEAAAQFLARQGSAALGPGSVSEVDGHKGLIIEVQGEFLQSIYFFAQNEGKLFAFSFYPRDEAFSQVWPDLDVLWRTIMNSFAFLPPETAAALLESGAYAPEATPTPRPYTRTTPGIPLPSFEFETYRDEEAGFEFDYPAAWTVSNELHAEPHLRLRHMVAPAPDPSTMNVAVTLWQPEDLDGYVALREQEWQESGMKIQSRQDWRLGPDRRMRAYCYLLEAETSRTMYLYLIAENGERYIVLSGTGDLDLMIEMAWGMRPVGLE